ncbi:DUF4183 domain-containing protein [Paenibacillus sp. FSL R10-2782]|uniref:DUF4183 domain-containing protein n=1 Tax=Paenibacillus sp. FSL R10-2782 TaxID=2954661 RepID=UPI00315822F8
MPIVKPVITAVSTAPVASGGVITTTIAPSTTRFFAAVTAGDIGATVTTILAGEFTDDSGAPIVAFPAVAAAETLNVYINGVLQQSSLSTLTTASLVLDTTDISVGVPVTVEIASFSSTTSTITTQPTISAPTVTITT